MYPVTEDFIQKMKADRRRVLARVEVDYTDPFLDQSLEIEANEQANVSYPQQTADSVDQTTRKYACLDGTWDLTSGEYHLAPSADQLTQQQFGWWGAQFADQDGYFAQPYPTLTVQHMPRPIRSLKVMGDSARGEYPVDFEIRLYGPDDTLLYAETVTGNDQVSWSKALEPQVLDVAKQELIITRWSRPGTCAKIIEFFTSIREVYETGDLMSIQLLEEREASQGSLPVGNISANEVTIALNNESKKFDLDNENSPLKNLLKPNRRIRVWLGAEAENAAAENPPTFTRNSVAYLSDGTQVAANQPRFEQGKFGKAFMMEEGTTNLLVKDLGAGGSGSISGSIIDILVPNKVWAKRITVEANNHFYFGIISVPAQPNTEYTLTYWARLVSGSVDRGTQIYIGSDSQGISGVALLPIDAELTSEWKKFVITGQTDANATTLTRATFRVETNTGCTVEIADWQLEAKPYATSFIDGTRAAESLTIPTEGVLNPQEGTISVWVYVNDIIKRLNPSATYGKMIFHISGGVFVNGLMLYHDLNAANWVLASFNDAGAASTITISDTITPNGWHMFSAAWNSQELKLLIDGQNVGNAPNPKLPTSFAPNMYIGSRDGVIAEAFANTLIDDLRISNRARTDEEIRAAYEAGGPLQRDESTTYLLTFNGSIYPVEMCWVPLGTFWSLDWDSPDDSLEATVAARDRMELLRKGTYQTSQVQQNKSLYEFAEMVLQDAGLTDDEYVIDEALKDIVVPYAWFGPISHREALRRIAEAGLAVAFQNRDGKIQIESFLLSGDEPVLDITEDDYFPPLRTPSRQQDVANEIIVDTQPLRPAANPEEVYRSNEPLTIPAHATVAITVFYNSQPVMEATAALENPPAGVSIVEATYYGWGANVKIRNSASTDQQVTLIITGKPLAVQNKERAVARDEASILENGLLTYEFPANPLVQTLAQAQAIADALLASVKEPRRDIEVDWRGNPALELGDRVTVKNQDYHIIRQEISWQGYLSARLTGRRAT